jgi:uncharacterized protein (TIGR02246 family)
MRTRLMLFLMLPLVACDTTRQTSETDEDAAAPANEAATRAQIEQLRNDWIAAAERDDAATIAPMYVDDAVMVGTGTPPASGREAIQEALAQGFPQSRNLRVTSRDLTVSGDVAYDYGEFSEEFTPPGGRSETRTGHYVVILKRQSDGNWKIVRHVSTMPSIPATTATRAPARRAD